MEEQYGYVDPSKITFLDEEEPSALKSLGKSAAQLGVQAIKAPFYLSELPARAVGALTGFDPSENLLSESIQKQADKYLGENKPSGVIEKGLQYTAGNWPAIFLGGGPLWAKALADLTGSTALAAAEEVSDNPLVHIGADILGRKGFSSARNLFKKMPKEPGKIRSYISDLYNKESEYGSKLSGKDASKRIYNKLNKIDTELSREYVNPGKFDEAAKNRVRANLETAEQALRKPRLTFADLSAESRRLNKAYAYKGTTENKYYQDIRKAFSEELEDLSKKYPKWGNFYNTSKELHSINKWQSGLGDWARNASSKGLLSKLVPDPLAQAGLGLMVGLSKGTKAGLLTTAAPAVGKLAVRGGEEVIRAGKFLNSLASTKKGKELLMNIVADSAKENFSSLNKNMKKFNEYAKEYSEENNNMISDYEYVDPSKITFLE